MRRSNFCRGSPFSCSVFSFGICVLILKIKRFFDTSQRFNSPNCFTLNEKKLIERIGNGSQSFRNPLLEQTLLHVFEELFWSVLVVNGFEKLVAKFVGRSVAVEKNETNN